MIGMKWLLMRIGLIGCLLLTPGLRAQTPAAVPAAAPRPVEPKIVVQAMAQVGIDVALWSADGRIIYTASGLQHELLVWEVARGIIIDRVRLPTPPSAAADMMRLYGMAVHSDGRSLVIDGEVLDINRDDRRGSRRYIVDVVSRQAQIVTGPPLRPLPAGQDWEVAINHWLDALSVIYGTGGDMSRADAERLLPPLPVSPDGRWAMVRAGKAFALRGADGQLRPTRVNRNLVSVTDAALSPDERYLVMLTMNEEPGKAGAESSYPVERLDLLTGRMLPRVLVPGDFDVVQWLGRDRFVLFQSDTDDDPLKDASEGAMSDVVTISAATGAVLARAPGRCFMAVLPNGGILGAGLANCRRNAGTDKSLQWLNNGQWVPLVGTQIPGDAHVRLIAAAPVGNRLAYVVRYRDGTGAIQIMNLATGAAELYQNMSKDALLTRLEFSADGRKLFIAGNGSLAEWQIDAPSADGTGVVRELPGTVLLPQAMASSAQRLMVGGGLEERIQVLDLGTGKALRPVNFAGATALGFMRSRPMLWAASTFEGIRFWDQRSGAVLMTIQLMPGSRQVVVAPDGRYDTNMGPESENFRWMITDQPFVSLAPQTLMRDFYEPRLISKLMDCTRAGNCATTLHKVPSVAGLNRQLPLVRMGAVRSLGPGMAEVKVEVQETRDSASGAQSGVYGIKLLMNNREIARNPDEPYAPPTPDLPSWRKANFSPPGDDQGRRYWSFTVPVPTDGKPIDFAAYSFNADRVKSDTVRTRWTPPPTPPRPRRAFVLTIGVNDYAETRLKLNFAVPDAQLISERLAAIPGYEMRHASLTSSPARAVTSDDVSMALSILAGFKGDGVREQLRANGHDVRALDEATPDDVVIISFSGHGFADSAGSFSLLASNAVWGALDAAPNPDTVIDAEDLTMWLRAIRAGEIAFIIDACHSGAAVNSPDFKPGPMGDPGLGQLAFDKGLRILAATQADDVALETASLNHGYLSYALGEGLGSQVARADFNRDGRIRLDEWLRYAVLRLPSLHEQVRSGGGELMARGVRIVSRTGSAPPRIQEPSLFDFNNAPSPVVLRGPQ